MHRRPRPGRPFGARALFALLALGALTVSAVAYAQTRSEGRSGRSDASKGPAKKARPPRPRLIEVPPAPAIGTTAQIRFHVAPRPDGRSGTAGPGAPVVRWRRFECRLDGGDWESCTSPRRLADLEPGDHAFAVRALNRRGRHGPAAHYEWRQLAPQRFTIDLLGPPPDDLMPGEPAQPLPLRIANPNDAPIEVTAIAVAIATEAPNCPSEPNFELTPSSVSPAAPLWVPAGGSVTLPSTGATAPAIALRELPVNQNACQNAEVPLVFSGEAHG